MKEVYSETQKQEHKRVFAERRRRQIILIVPLVLVVVAIRFAKHGNFLGLPESAAVAGFLLFIAGALAFSFYNWRCPACDAYLGKEISPNFCVKCGAELSD